MIRVMAVPQQRDPNVTRRRLAEWCATHIAGGSPVTVGAVRTPSSGFANETLIFEMSHHGRTEHMVARVSIPSYQVYPGDCLADEAKVLRLLGERTDVAVPAVHGYEPDPGVLGGPFLVMEYVPGRVPADFPSYHRGGWVAELSEQDRHILWDNGLRAMSLVHRLDPVVLGLDFAGLDGQIEYYAEALDFYRAADSPVALAALDWLRANRPGQSHPSGLLWGDARLGNILFDHLAPAALLDWEMVALGPAEVDLAWYLYLDRHLSEGIGATRLPGLPSRTATISRYSGLLGRPLDDLSYYEVFAGFRFALITARVTQLAVQHGIVPVGTDFPLHRNATRLLERTLHELERGHRSSSSPGSAA
jgi:aminoglycoside phosphotransferase (APT) family kinase protein